MRDLRCGNGERTMNEGGSGWGSGGWAGSPGGGGGGEGPVMPYPANDDGNGGVGSVWESREVAYHA